MAALVAPGPELVDLRRVSSTELAPLLAEECDHWRRLLNWDFERSAELVRRFTDLRALNGAALISQRGSVIGYCYYVIEDNKGLLGDVFVREHFRTEGNENRLLAAAIEGLLRGPVDRVETQLMMFPAGPAFLSRLRGLPGGRHLRVYERDFMEIDLACNLDLARPGLREPQFDMWMPVWQDAAARIIADSYHGHVDSQINDQYRSLAGARRFLYNIVQYPGCGIFNQGASLIALDPETRTLLGICLTSNVGPAAGHITQLCVAPSARGRGIGRALLFRALRQFRLQNCRTVSLTVTSSNREALRLYLQTGFRSIRHFPACVWEGLHHV